MAFNSDIGTPFANFPNQNDWFGYFSDFLSDEDITEGVFTAVASGTNSVIDTLSGGYGRISGAATTDDSGGGWQLDASNFTVASGKKIQFMTTAIVSDATQSDFLFGLTAVDTTLVAGVSDGIYFRKDDGDALLDLVVMVGSVATGTITGVATVVAATEVKLAFEIIPTAEAVATVNFYVDGTLKGTLPLAIASTVLLVPSIGFQTGDASGTKTLDFDYIGARKQR